VAGHGQGASGLESTNVTKGGGKRGRCGTFRPGGGNCESFIRGFLHKVGETKGVRSAKVFEGLRGGKQVPWGGMKKGGLQGKKRAGGSAKGKRGFNVSRGKTKGRNKREKKCWGGAIQGGGRGRERVGLRRGGGGGGF